jgi:SAM-dependent methyltransferase
MEDRSGGTTADDSPSKLEPVSLERWQEAQRWEQAFWDRLNVPPPWWKRALRPLLVVAGLRPPRGIQEFDDRNNWWKSKFDNYSSLPSHFERVLELGCGPYTNVRLIRQTRSITHLHCSDPLAHRYITYPQGWLATAYRSGEVTVDSYPAEDCAYKSGFFDLTVLINVLDHVKDPLACLAEALRVTAAGGYMVFGQDLTGRGDRTPSNPGHPFTFSRVHLEPTLDRECDRVFHRVIPREEVDEPEMHCGALAYIGRKRGSAR